MINLRNVSKTRIIVYLRTISIFNMMSKLFFFVEVVFLYVCMTPFGQCQSQNITTLKMNLVTSLENKLITDLALWSRQGSGSRAGCASDCVRDDRCVSFFYNVNTDVCTAHSVQFYGTEPSLSDVGSLYYTMNIDKRDCADILTTEPSSPDGVYIINPMDGMGAIRVYCDMTTDGGGWTVFQRRQDGTFDFYLNWAEYKSGFGNLNGGFWLGNDIISRLTAASPSQLRIDMKDQGDLLGYAKYSTFVMDSEANNYMLTVSGYTGNRGDSLSHHDGMAFSTKDVDHDMAPINCAELRYGGWWYGSCHQSNLNGMYGNNDNSDGINWKSWHGFSYSLKWTEMKLKPA